MMKNPIDDALKGFSPTDVTVRVCDAIFGSVPFAPKLPTYASLDEATRVLYPAATLQQQKRVEALAQAENVKSALWMADAIDTGDTGIAIYSGVSSALSFFFGNRANALETDTQQGVDTGLKLFGIAYMVHKLFPGTVQEKATSFYTTPTGQALAFYFASIDVVLPFADNALIGGGNAIQTILQRYGGASAQKLAAIPGGSQIAAEAQSMVGSLVAPLEGAVRQVAPHARAIADSAAKHLPGFMNAADKVAGIVATGADVLPIYRFLGARLAAESCVLLASRGQ